MTPMVMRTALALVMPPLPPSLLELKGVPPQVMVDSAAVEQHVRVAQEHVQLPIEEDDDDDADADGLWPGEVFGLELGRVPVDGEGVPPSVFGPWDAMGEVEGEDPGTPAPGLTEGELLTLPLPPGTTATGDVVPVDVPVEVPPEDGEGEGGS